MKLTFLGTGTSTGVPQIGCKCQVCRSTDKRDNRLRTSALLTTDEGKNILIDCGPDFRAQILREGSPAIDAVILTHSHYDHVGGLDDLRPYSINAAPPGLPVYCRSDVASDLVAHMPYCFVKHPYPGAPRLNLIEIEKGVPFACCGMELLPMEVKHLQPPIFCYRIGRLGYVTDCKQMPDETIEALRGVATLVINALHHEPHPSHLCLDEAIELARRIDAGRTYFTHMSHRMGPHAYVPLPEGMALAYDGLSIDV